jgi:hypothetical protein
VSKKWTIKGMEDLQKTRWEMSSNLYEKRAFTEVEHELSGVDQTLSTKVSTPMSLGYRLD